MNITLDLKRGLDIHIAGATQNTPDRAETVTPRYVTLTPDDFPGLTLKPVVKEGDTVVKGAPVLQDKHNPSVYITAPAPGTIKSIARGERRKLMHVTIDVTQSSDDAMRFESKDIHTPEAARMLLQTSGLWAMIRQRPYNIVAAPGSTARDIFVNALDTAPLAPDMEAILTSRSDDLCAGVAILSKLTDGNIYIGRRHNGGIPDIAGAEMVDIKGYHPAGNPGVMAANIKPVNKGETIWTLDGITLARIGHLARTGQLDTGCIVAVTGSEVKSPAYIKTIIGADIESILHERLNDTTSHKRIISGNVLSGIAVNRDMFLRFPYTQITVIPEGDDVVEFMGWASLSPKKMSTSRSFPGHFMPKKLFRPDARLSGGRRAIIMSGQYDKVVPMDIMTEYLIKAILSHNIEKMEALGIYEVAPEDFAVAEYVCTSKMPLQSIVAQGLEYLRKELE